MTFGPRSFRLLLSRGVVPSLEIDPNCHSQHESWTWTDYKVSSMTSCLSVMKVHWPMGSKEWRAMMLERLHFSEGLSGSE